MNSRTLSILGIAALIVIIGAWWLSTAHGPSSQTAVTLYPALKSKLDAVQTVKIYRAGDELAVEIVRDGNEFRIQQRAGYAADASKVRALLMNLESAKLREEKTSNPDNYAALGVQATADANATGTRIELAGKDIGSPINLIVGKNDAGSRTTYVRRAEDKTSWLVDVALDANADPKQWLQRMLVDIAADRVAEATTELAGAKSYSVAKANRGAANFDVNAIPKGRELSSVSAPNAIAQALASLSLDDVRPGSELANEKSAGRVVLHTFDGVTIECTGYASGEQRWIALKATFDEVLAKRFYRPDPKAAKDESDAALTAAIKKGHDEVEALNKKFTGWAFAIPMHKYDTLFKPLEQLLKTK